MIARLVFAVILTGSFMAPLAVMWKAEWFRGTPDIPLLTAPVENAPADVNAARAQGYITEARRLLSNDGDRTRACRLLARAAAISPNEGAALRARHCGAR
jgi:hypothetical protein